MLLVQGPSEARSSVTFHFSDFESWVNEVKTSGRHLDRCFVLIVVFLKHVRRMEIGHHSRPVIVSVKQHNMVLVRIFALRYVRLEDSVARLLSSWSQPLFLTNPTDVRLARISPGHDFLVFDHLLKNLQLKSYQKTGSKSSHAVIIFRRRNLTDATG